MPIAYNNSHYLFYLQIQITFYLNYLFLRIYILMDLIVLAIYKIQKLFRLLIRSFLNLFWLVRYRGRKMKSSKDYVRLLLKVNKLSLQILNGSTGCSHLHARTKISNRLTVNFLFLFKDKVKPKLLSDCPCLWSEQI